MLLRIEGSVPVPFVFILMKDGEGVDVDALLDDDEYLDAICMIHHLDHYRSLNVMDPTFSTLDPTFRTPD